MSLNRNTFIFRRRFRYPLGHLLGNFVGCRPSRIVILERLPSNANILQIPRHESRLGSFCFDGPIAGGGQALIQPRRAVDARGFLEQSAREDESELVIRVVHGKRPLSGLSVPSVFVACVMASSRIGDKYFGKTCAPMMIRPLSPRCFSHATDSLVVNTNALDSLGRRTIVL